MRDAKAAGVFDHAALVRILTAALGSGEYADLYFERRLSQSYRLQDGKIHEGAIALTSGVGIRVISGECSGYAHSDVLELEVLLETARVASLIARGGSRAANVATPAERAVKSVYDPRAFEAGEIEPQQFIELLARADVAARKHDPRISAVNALITNEIQEITIVTSDGLLVRDRRPLLTLGVQAVASAGGERGSGYLGDGGRTGIAFFDTMPPEKIATEAARVACVNVEGRQAPAGEFTVVVGAGGGGVLLHEAVGHGLEGDFNRQGTSLYSGRVGERVASELVTIYDDGNVPGERGSLSIDDEGTPGAHKVLVERGILRGYMQDRLNAKLMGTASTGSGRRQSFRYLPQPRMCNTYMPGGESLPEDIIASVERGVYAKSFAGGQVEISRGDFVFMVAEGYLIENGKVTAPLRNATLIGNGPEVMTKVVAVGNDGRFAGGHYTCGKGGQMVPVGVGMPTVKLSAVTVGGSHVGA